MGSIVARASSVLVGVPHLVDNKPCRWNPGDLTSIFFLFLQDFWKRHRRLRIPIEKQALAKVFTLSGQTERVSRWILPRVSLAFPLRLLQPQPQLHFWT